MKTNRKIFAYSNNSSYVVCSCVINDELLKKFMNDIKSMNNSCYYLHKFDNMLGRCDQIIDLGVFYDDLIVDTDKCSKITSKFLDVLEIKDRKVSSLEEYSQRWRHAQYGTFGENINNDEKLRGYKTAISNYRIIDTIGYDLDDKFVLENTQKVKCKK